MSKSSLKVEIWEVSRLIATEQTHVRVRRECVDGRPISRWEEEGEAAFRGPRELPSAPKRD